MFPFLAQFAALVARWAGPVMSVGQAVVPSSGVGGSIMDATVVMTSSTVADCVFYSQNLSRRSLTIPDRRKRCMTLEMKKVGIYVYVR